MVLLGGGGGSDQYPSTYYTTCEVGGPVGAKIALRNSCKSFYIVIDDSFVSLLKVFSQNIKEFWRIFKIFFDPLEGCIDREDYHFTCDKSDTKVAELADQMTKNIESKILVEDPGKRTRFVGNCLKDFSCCLFNVSYDQKVTPNGHLRFISKS